MTTVTLARNAMATRFELVLHGGDPVALRAAGEEALDEVELLEARLSLFRPTSEIAHVNARAANEPVRVTPEVFRLLAHAQRLTAETGGAFDITIAPLVRLWGFWGDQRGVPAPEELDRVRALVGMDQVRLNPEDLTVRFARPGVMLDLGAIGKGYAIERAASLLREAGVTAALLHGGTSTVYALGRPPGADCWRVAVTNPRAEEGASTAANVSAPGVGAAPVATALLKDESMSVSAVWGRSFEAEGEVFGHVLDPRSGRPARQAVLAAVVLPSATETDALSTALLTLGSAGLDRLAALRPGVRTLLIRGGAEGFPLESRGGGWERSSGPPQL